MKRSILVLIPVYNGEKTIEKLVNLILEKKECYNLDILVVNDGSKDATLSVLSKLKDKIHIISHAKNQGKGMALKTGFNYLLRNKEKYKAVITLDSDLQHDPNDLPLFIKEYENFDIILGSRLHDIKNMPFSRKLANFCSSFFATLFVGQKVSDCQTGYRLIKTEVLQNLSLAGEGYELETELILQAGFKKYKIGSVEIKTIYNDSVSYINKFDDTIKVIKTFWRYLLDRRKYVNTSNK